MTTDPQPSPLRLDVPDDVTRRVRAKIKTAASVTSRGALGIWHAFPTFKAAVDALPDLGALAEVRLELRSIPLLGYRDEGHNPPREVWEALGLGEMYIASEG